MMSMKNIIKICLSGLMLVMFATGCKVRDDQNILVMGTSADYYPFEFIDFESGEIVGFDIDLARHIANELGYDDLEIVDMDFNTLITALRSGRVDMVLAGMTPTPERLGVVDFSDIYHSSQEVILAASDHVINSIDDLSGLIIGVQTGTLQEDIANQLLEDGLDAEIMTMDRIPELIQQLIIGRVDVVIIDQAVTSPYLAIHQQLAVFEIFDLDSELKGSAIALPKGSELTEQINEILADMKASGLMNELILKWFN